MYHQFMHVVFLSLSGQLLMTTCACRNMVSSAKIGCILHYSWSGDMSVHDHILTQENCMVNLTIMISVIDTDNGFKLKRTVATFLDYQLDLLLIGPNLETCTLPQFKSTLAKNNVIIKLPCHFTGHQDTTPIQTWISPKQYQPVWHILRQYVTTSPQKSVVVLYDEGTGRFLSEFIGQYLTPDLGIKLTVLNTQRFESPATRHDFFLYVHHELYVKGIYGVLLGTESTIFTMLEELNTIDVLFPRVTDFRHRSFWLAVTRLTRPGRLAQVSGLLENIAIVSPGYPSYDQTISTPVTDVIINEIYRALKENLDKCSNQTGKDVSRIITQYLRSAFHTMESGFVNVFTGQGMESSRQFHQSRVPSNLHDIQSLLFPNTKYGYNLRHLDIVIVPWPGFMEKLVTGGTVVYQGMCIDILHVMQKQLNFTYTLYENKERTWGTVENGKWIGMVGDLHRKEADLALGDITIHYQRDQVIDFILPAFQREVTDIVYRLQTTEEFSWKKLSRPFQPMVILCIVSALLFVMAFIAISERFNPYYRNNTKQRLNPLVMSWRTLWYLLGSILMQGGKQETSSWTGRVLISTWWLFCIVLGATYSATLIVSFAVKEKFVPFKSLADLVNNEEYKWGLIDGSIAMLIMTNSTRPDFMKAIDGVHRFAQTDPNVLSKNLDVQLKKVQTEKYAFISARVTLEYMKTVSKPLGYDLEVVGDSLYSTHVALAVPDQSPMLSDFEKVMATISEIGLLETWHKKWWSQIATDNPALILGGKPITMCNMFNVFTLVGLGTIGSVLALTLENIVSKILSRRSRKRNVDLSSVRNDHSVDIT